MRKQRGRKECTCVHSEAERRTVKGMKENEKEKKKNLNMPVVSGDQSEMSCVGHMLYIADLAASWLSV